MSTLATLIDLDPDGGYGTSYGTSDAPLGVDTVNDVRFIAVRRELDDLLGGTVEDSLITTAALRVLEAIADDLVPQYEDDDLRGIIVKLRKERAELRRQLGAKRARAPKPLARTGGAK